MNQSNVFASRQPAEIADGIFCPIWVYNIFLVLSIVLHCIAFYSIVWYGMAWYGIVLYCIVLYLTQHKTT